MQKNRLAKLHNRNPQQHACVRSRVSKLSKLSLTSAIFASKRAGPLPKPILSLRLFLSISSNRSRDGRCRFMLLYNVARSMSYNSCRSSSSFLSLVRVSSSSSATDINRTFSALCFVCFCLCDENASIFSSLYKKNTYFIFASVYY